MAGNAANTRSLKVLVYTGGFGALLFTLPTVVILAAGMAPTLIAYMTEKRREKYTTMCIGSMNFVGVLPYIIDLWQEDHTYDRAFMHLSDPFVWLVMLSAASVGWVINTIAPNVVQVYLSMRLEQRIASLRRRQRQLVEEWGPGVAGESPPVVDEDDEMAEGEGQAAA